MTPEPIAPDQVPTWVPGRLTLQNSDDWQGIAVRGYQYGGSDVEVPPMRDFLIVAYRRGTSAMRRRTDGPWVDGTMQPGDISLLTRATASHWARRCLDGIWFRGATIYSIC